VIASKDPDVAVGEHVGGLLGVQEYAIANGKGVFKVDPSLAPLPVYLGALGMPGVTAYFGLLDIGKPQPGQTVLVSGAAGAVGGLVGQIARLKGARAVGIAGGPEKCGHLLDDLGFDATIDYKSEDLDAALGETCPNGVDVYFDNVGGEILDAALAHLARNARVVICGAISQYNNTEPVRGPSNYLSLLVNHASMTGFVMSDYLARYGEAVAEMAGWLASGQLVSREDIARGLENFPEVLLRLFSGENTGKLVLEL
jgi:NADPH-dependent curcumin reductase CurA